jgi:hypothetical protein
MNGDTKIGDDYVLQIYTWLDKIPFSRPKRNVARDFSDGGSSYFLVGKFRYHGKT